MIEYIDSIDKQLLLFLNSMHSTYFDTLMWYVSKTATWSLMLVILLYILFKDNWRQAIIIVIGIALTITLADQISSGIIKGAVERLRPTHNPDIENLVHIVREYKGGLYGFVSSHAANTIGVAMFLSLLFKNKCVTITMFVWALFVSYSRIYLGVHYPGDILGGICVGLFSGTVSFKLYIQAKKWKKLNKNIIFTDITANNAKKITIGILSNLLITVGVSAIICFLA